MEFVWGPGTVGLAIGRCSDRVDRRLSFERGAIFATTRSTLPHAKMSER
jgi:hypothetical protein